MIAEFTVLHRFRENDISKTNSGFSSCGERGFMTTREIAGKITTEAESTARTNEDIRYITGILRKVLLIFTYIEAA